MGVALQIRKCMDRLAKGRQSQLAAYAAGYVFPMFTNVDSYISGALSDDDQLDFYALPDRIIAL